MHQVCQNEMKKCELYLPLCEKYGIWAHLALFAYK